MSKIEKKLTLVERKTKVKSFQMNLENEWQLPEFAKPKHTFIPIGRTFPQSHCTKNPIYVCPEMKLRGLAPRIGLPI
jgi:hypothetical protein